MRSNNKHSIKELEKYIQMYLEDGHSYSVLKKNYGLLISQSTFNQKVQRYQDYGIVGIQSKSTNNHYSIEFKTSVVKEHLDGATPIKQLARKYNIPSDRTVRELDNQVY